jgi:hypothetical protein
MPRTSALPLTGRWVTCQGNDRLRGALLGGEAGRLADRVTITITSIP